MLRVTQLRDSLRRMAVTVCALALVVVTFGGAQASASVSGIAKQKPTINTFKKWNGSQIVASFGCPDTTTYGQVIHVPGHRPRFDKVTWVWSGAGGSMVVRGELYAWDGTKATGSPLFESAPRTISFADSDWHHVSFNTGRVRVRSGHDYVIFASIDKDFEQCTNGYSVVWGAVRDKSYDRGTFVYQNNGGDESRWTATAWFTAGIDSTFKAYLSTFKAV